MAGTLSIRQLDAVAGLFRVLSEPTRLALLQALSEGPLNVGELVKLSGVKQANVSKQLGILHSAGLLTREREGNVITYEIADPLVFQLCDLVCSKLKRDAERQFKALSGRGR